MLNEKKFKKVEKALRKEFGDKATFIFVIHDGEQQGNATAFGILNAKDESKDLRASGLGCVCLTAIKGVTGTIADMMGSEDDARNFAKNFIDAGDAEIVKANFDELN